MDILQCLDSNKVKYQQLRQKDAYKIEKHWLENFCPNVKKTTGKWVYRGYKWHAFNFDFENHKKGEKAKQCYKEQKITSYYVFNEELTYCLTCQSDSFPDLSDVMDDLYVCDANFRWTMVFPNEADMGPYFAALKGSPISRPLSTGR